MAIAITLREYLDQFGFDYELIRHSYAATSRGSAESAHVPAREVAKPVLLEDEKGYLMAVIPASHRVEMGSLERQLGRRMLLATEDELRDVFTDCARGAVPPLGQAYGIDVLWDDSLSECRDVYFEAGDHTDLVHMSGRDFCALMGRAKHARFSYPEAS